MNFQVNTDWWKEIFDDIYLLTDGRSVCDTALTTAEVDFIESALSLDKSAPILDLCGGQGRHAIELSRRGFTNVTVLDYSDYLIRMGKQQANQQNLNTFFIQGDARDTNFIEESYGAVIIMGGSFGYFVHDEENKKILKETFRLLMPKGELLLDLPDKKYVLKNFKPVSIHKAGDTIEVTRTRELEHDVIYCREIVTCTEKGCLRENNYCVRLYTPEKISGILSSIGFSDIFFQEDFMDRQEKGDYGTMTNRMVVKCCKEG
jgi:D-alanine-D-alanine ligase